MSKISKKVLVTSLLLNQILPIAVSAAEVVESESVESATEITTVEEPNFYDKIESIDYMERDNELVTEQNDEAEILSESHENLDSSEKGRTIAFSDDEAPVILGDTLTVSTTTPEFGEDITFSIKATDNVAVTNLTISVYSDKAGYASYVYLDLNESTGVFEGTLDFDRLIANGTWHVQSIWAFDAANNSTFLYNIKSPGHETEEGIDLSRFDLTVSGVNADYELPEIIVESLKVNKKEINTGEVLEISVKIEDESELSKAIVLIENKEVSAREWIDLTLDTSDNTYKGSFQITDTTYNGLWKIGQIYAEDIYRNENGISNVDLYDYITAIDLSAHDFTVINAASIKPSLNFDTFKISQKSATSGNVVKYSIEPIGFDKVKDSVIILYNNETGQTKELRLKFNSKTNKLETEFHVYDDTALGTWRVHIIRILSESGYFFHENYIIEELRSERDLSHLNLTVVGKDALTPAVSYRTHVQSFGWQPFVKDGAMSGTSGQAKRLEGIEIKLDNLPYAGGIEYQTHVQSYGWMNWAKNGTMSGTSGEAKRLEGIRIKLTGELAKHYDVYYRVHAESFGWLDWTKNGEASGTEGLAKRLEGIEVQLVKKGEKAPGATKRPYILTKPSVSYTTHVQKDGWQAYVKDGQMAGTSGRALRLEGIKMQVSDPTLTGGIEYRTHVQKIGWQDWKANDDMSGTSGQALRLEAIQIRLTGELAKHYDVYYRVHAQSYGWLGWAKSGESSGTEGLGKRLEGIEVRLVRKGGKAPGTVSRSFVKK